MKILCLLLSFLSVLSQFRSHRCNKEKEAKLIRIYDSQAKCLDGSPPAYYIKRGHGDGKYKYMIFFEGGGWCYNLDNCSQRSFKDYGSSKRYPTCLPHQEMKYYISPEFSRNPIMWNWNIIRVKYCDATSYSGDAVINYKNQNLYFKGKNNRDATIQSLLSLAGMNEATDVVIAGCSAGGLGIFLGLDQMRDAIHKVNKSTSVVGLADSAMFLDYSSNIPSAFQNSYGAEAITDGVVNYPATMRRIFYEYNISAGANTQCLLHHHDKPNQCIFTQNLAPFITTPIFVLQPQYDQWQLWHVIGLSDAAFINPFGRNVTRMVVERVLASKPYHGAFIESCTHHCTSCSSSGEDSWNGPRIKSTRSPDQGAYTEAVAFQRWYTDLQSDPSFRKYLYGSDSGIGSAQGASVSLTAKVQSLNSRGQIDLSSYRHAYMQDGADKENDDIYTKPLVEDIERLSKILSNIVRTESNDVHNLYDKLIGSALSRSQGDKTALNKMKEATKDVTPEIALGVTRAFTQTLNLINAAEVHHRMRYLRELDFEVMSPLPKREDSMAGAIESVLSESTKDQVERKKLDIYDTFMNQKVEIVYTAHPTEVNRRTMLRKYRDVSEMLATLDRKDLSLYERMQTEDSLRRVIASLWGSDEIRREKPTPQQEAQGGLAILESVLWDAVPSYLRKLNSQFIMSLGKSLPVTHAPIKFASWMGGDRDGNPNVTPKVTFEVAMMQRLQAAKLYLLEIDKLYAQLAICKGFSNDMLGLAREIRHSPDRRELYRRVIGHLQQRLLATVAWCDRELATTNAQYESSSSQVSNPYHPAATSLRDSTKTPNLEANPDEYVCILKDSSFPMFETDELLQPLVIMHESLTSGGYAEVADGLLIDIIRRVCAFGLTLCPLDLRQESGRHADALDAITRYLGIGSYAQWDENSKINWLQNELAGKRPLYRNANVAGMGLSPTQLDTLRTFEMAASLGSESLGAYVISQARSASDVLAVMLLQKQYGMTANSGKMMRVVPLFETLVDLTNAPQVMGTLFSLPNYLGMTRNKHEVMIGYSDSAKDAGRLSAGWAQYESQEKMVRVADKFGVELTFFHGKGGTVGRGGNPALYRAVLAHPPRTINGRFRVTEQGEMITQNFGSISIAERTLDIYTAAVLAEQFVKHVEPLPKWRALMNDLGQVSCDSYQTLIKQKSFIRYFRQSSPELELGSLNIGSRPAKRNPEGGIESLRAIPWTFAWSQIRLHLPAWFGVAEALDTTNNPQLEADLKEMYNNWPFFRETIDLIAMTLSKADPEIAQNYESQLIDSSESDLVSLGGELRHKLQLTRDRILVLTGAEDMSNGFKMLQRSMKTRYPYVDPLNVIQAEVMKRLRKINASASAGSSASSVASSTSAHDKSLLEDTLIVSINGISQGMKNSG